jgi:poly-gamma-glutamate synthesis protein (capsule biosynthesis protein)
MYFADVDAASAVVSLEIVPLQIRNFRFVQPSSQDVEWLQQLLDRECRRLATRVMLNAAGRLVLVRDRSSAPSVLHNR